jgi:membrane-associated phospholipid phosphatase
MILTWITVRSQRTFSGSAGRTGFRQASRRTDGTTGFDTDGDGRQFLRPTAYGAEQGPPMTRQDSARTPASDAAGGVAQRLADGLGRRGNQVRGRAAEGLRELGAIDRAVYSAVAATPTPSLDEPLRRLSNAANNSGLWLAAAAGLGVAGGGAGRRAAVRGTVAIGVTSALVNLAVKSAWSRQRPDRAGTGVPVRRNVRMPSSTSFPSGHAASGFAFAAAIGRDQPWLGLALRFLAAAVAYSRVHTGVHYPGDAVIGALIGEGTGQAVAGLMDRLPPAGKAFRSGRDKQHELPDAADSEGTPNPESGRSRAVRTRRRTAASVIPAPPETSPE